MKEMNLKNKLYQGFVVDKIRELALTDKTKYPLVVELDPTDVCDLACKGCINEEMMNTKNSFSRERLLELGKEFYESGVKAVVLIGGGEPLAHPATHELISYLGKHDIHVGITTNGTLIDRYVDVIGEYSKWTRISVDAGTDETYQKLRPTRTGESKFQKVIDNMRMLAKVKKGTLGYSFLIRTEADKFGIVPNILDIYPAAKLAKDIGCDYFEVKPSYSYVDNTDHILVKHDLEIMKETSEIIDSLAELETDSFKIIKALNLKHSLKGEIEQPKEYTTCPATSLRTLITPSGAFVCPYFRGKDRMNIGEVKEQSFLDMWNGAQRNDVMEKLNPSYDCTMHCLRNSSNLEVFKLIKSIKDGEDIDIVEKFDHFI